MLLQPNRMIPGKKSDDYRMNLSFELRGQLSPEFNDNPFTVVFGGQEFPPSYPKSPPIGVICGFKGCAKAITCDLVAHFVDFDTSR